VKVARSRLSKVTKLYLMSRAKREDEHVFTLDTETFNRELRAHTKRKGTSYSFRNRFMRESIDRHTSNGCTDWKAVASVTMHTSGRALQAAYDHPDS
jgi:hypothetical protein